MNDIVKRHEKLAFYGVPTASGGSTTYTFHRMKGFDTISTSKNPKEYSRQYVDEDHEQTDVVGYSPSIAYTFDRYAGNTVQADIVKITNQELTGNDALVDIVVVDTADTQSGGCTAVKRAYAVIPDSEGDSADAYTYSGNFKVKGGRVLGTATVSEDGLTCTFTASAA